MMTTMDRMADRENLPVEIALLVSLLLHAMAYWHVAIRRDTLLKMPWLSSLTKLVHVAHTQPGVGASRRYRPSPFVELNEPRPQNQPDQGKQSQQFLETDASQATGEKPKSAQYYSDKSTVAANRTMPAARWAIPRIWMARRRSTKTNRR